MQILELMVGIYDMAMYGVLGDWRISKSGGNSEGSYTLIL